ncbi:MAG: hypothetical protein ACREFQ_02190, partial [Stellaceae bacterium]
PYIPFLQGGAEVYGLLSGVGAGDAFFQPFDNGAPKDAVATLSACISDRTPTITTLPASIICFSSI